MPPTNSLLSLRTRFQPVAQAWKEMCEAYVLPLRFPGYKLRITETLRDVSRQEELEKSGASKVKFGWHNVGLALDFAILDERGEYVADGSHLAYRCCGLVAESLGCVWGGSWQHLKDSGHIEWHVGFTMEQFRSAMGAGKDLSA